MPAELGLDDKQRAAFDRYVAAMRARNEKMRQQVAPLFAGAWEEMAKPEAKTDEVTRLFAEVAAKRQESQRDSVVADAGIPVGAVARSAEQIRDAWCANAGAPGETAETRSAGDVTRPVVIAREATQSPPDQSSAPLRRRGDRFLPQWPQRAMGRLSTLFRIFGRLPDRRVLGRDRAAQPAPAETRITHPNGAAMIVRGLAARDDSIVLTATIANPSERELRLNRSRSFVLEGAGRARASPEPAAREPRPGDPAALADRRRTGVHRPARRPRRES